MSSFCDFVKNFVKLDAEPERFTRWRQEQARRRALEVSSFVPKNNRRKGLPMAKRKKLTWIQQKKKFLREVRRKRRALNYQETLAEVDAARAAAKKAVVSTRQKLKPVLELRQRYPLFAIREVDEGLVLHRRYPLFVIKDEAGTAAAEEAAAAGVAVTVAAAEEVEAAAEEAPDKDPVSTAAGAAVVRVATTLRRSRRLAVLHPRRSARLAAKPRVSYAGMCA